MLIPKHMKASPASEMASERDRLIEGIARARRSSLSDGTIEALHHGEVTVSDNIEGRCTLRSPSIREAVAIQDIQDATNASVWHAIRTNVATVGDILVMLYVPEESEQWDGDNYDLDRRSCLAYVASMPYGETDTAQIAMRLTSEGLYATYIKMSTSKLVRQIHRKALD